MPRTVSVAITANTSGFTAGMGKISASAKGTAASVKASFDHSLTAIAKSGVHLDKVGSSLTKIGLVGAAGLGLSTKAAIDWESAWAGVTKTTSGSAEQMGKLEDQLRGLARTLPESHEQIAAVAEAAGQLGIQRDSISEFTKTMVQLGDTTNLTADDAATKLAQFGNIMGTLNGPANQVNDNISRLGATIVGLGNDGASTESQIVDMGLRIAGAGKAVGLTSQQVLGFSSAIASTGINVEAGGTAMSKVFIKLDQQVREGGDGLTTLAQTAGVSSKAFAQSFKTDAAGATTAFIEGLGKVQAAGGDTTKVLKSLGITGQYETDVLRRLSSANDLVATSLTNANTQYRQNSALVNEAAKRYATSGAQAKIALNQVKDTAITVGQQMLPAFAQVASVVGHVASAFGAMSGPAQSAAVAVGLTVTSVGLLGGAGIKAVTALAGLRGAFQAAGVASSVASKSFKIAGLSIPVIGVGIFAATTAIQHFAAQTTIADEAATGYAQAMQTIEGNVNRATAAINANVREQAIQSLTTEGAFDLADKLGISLASVTDATLGNKDALAEVNKALSGYIAVGPQVSGIDAERRTNAFALAKILNANAKTEINNVRIEQQRRRAMEESSVAGKASADSYIAVASALDALGSKSSAGADATAKLAGTLFKAGDAAQNAVAVHSQYAAAIDDADKAIDKNGTTLNKANTRLSDNTAKGRENIAVLSNLASSGKAYVQSLVAQGASQRTVVNATRNVRGEFTKAAEAAGLTAEQAGRLANSFGLIPRKISIRFDAIGLALQQAKVDEFRESLKKLPAGQQARIGAIYDKSGAKAALEELNRLNGVRVHPRILTKSDARQVASAASRFLGTIKDGKAAIKTESDVKRVAGQARAYLRSIKDVNPKVLTKKDLTAAAAAKAFLRSLKDKPVTVKVGASGVGAAQSAINGIHGHSVTIRVNRENVGKKVGDAPGLASGGHITGPGTATSDSIPAWLSDGEYVIRAAAVKAVGLTTLHGINAKGYASGGSVKGYAKGGKVSADTELLRVIIAQHNLDEAKSLRERIAATKVLNKATKKLSEAQTAAADAAKTMASSLADPYKSKSHDIDDWLTSMREGASHLVGFNTQVAQLRKLGLSQTLIQSITDQGALVGSELAEQILAGGKGLADTLNQANANLTKAADAVGIGVIGIKGHALGGPVFGPGSGTSDSITARLSNGEYVVNAAATAANRSVLDAINYGRTVVDHRFTPNYASGGYVRQPVVTHQHHSEVNISGNNIIDPEKLLRTAKNRQRDAMTMAGLSRSL